VKKAGFQSIKGGCWPDLSLWGERLPLVVAGVAAAAVIRRIRPLKAAPSISAGNKLLTAFSPLYPRNKKYCP
jgi:hypothetical protein